VLAASARLLAQVLEEEILPALEKLRKERSAYMQWVASSENLDRLRRFCIAHEFTAAKQLQDDSETQMLSLQVREPTRPIPIPRCLYRS
jgi:structural maintenance of chromosome 2